MTSGEPPSEEEALVEMVRKLVADAMAVARADFELAKLQMRQAMVRLGIAIGLIAAAAVLLLIAVIDMFGAIPEALGPRLLGSTWLGWLVTGAIFLVIAGILAFLGTLRVRRSFSEGKQTVDTLKEDVEWLRALTKRSGSGS
jgi:hypothetical protein